MACAICETRKEKRFCPAVHGRICPQCCGAEREVTLDCPSSCPYLQQARQHEKPRSLEEIAASGAELFPNVDVTPQFSYEREPLLAGLSFGIVKMARADRELHDRDVIAALTSMAQTWQRRSESGLEYQAAPASGSQQALTAELERMIGEYRELERQHLGTSTLRDSDVLRALVFLVRLAHNRTNGRPRSRALLDFLETMFPPKESAVITPAEAGSRIIVP